MNNFSILLTVLGCCCLLFTGCGSKLSYLGASDIVIEDETEEEAGEIDPSDESDDSYDSSIIYVQVAGAVASPGVYELSAGSRVYNAIEAAGGMRSDAYDRDINQASLVADGDKIYIPTSEEVGSMISDELSGAAPDDASDGRVNINTADVTLLMTLPGIGAARADAIVAYRSDHGAFADTESLKNVSGIGDTIFNRIAELICV